MDPRVDLLWDSRILFRQLAQPAIPHLAGSLSEPDRVSEYLQCLCSHVCGGGPFRLSAVKSGRARVLDRGNVARDDGACPVHKVSHVQFYYDEYQHGADAVVDAHVEC